jgi:hypothetical protein
MKANTQKIKSLLYFSFLLAIGLTFGNTTLNAQSNQPIFAEAPADYTKWENAKNWVAPYQKVFGNQASKDWLVRLSIDMTMYENKQSDALIVVVKDDFESIEQAVDAYEYNLSELGLQSFGSVDAQWSSYLDSYHIDFIGQIGNQETKARLLLAQHEGEVYTMLYLLTNDQRLPDNVNTTLQQVAKVNAIDWGTDLVVK